MWKTRASTNSQLDLVTFNEMQLMILFLEENFAQVRKCMGCMLLLQLWYSALQVGWHTEGLSFKYL